MPHCLLPPSIAPCVRSSLLPFKLEWAEAQIRVPFAFPPFVFSSAGRDGVKDCWQLIHLGLRPLLRSWKNDWNLRGRGKDILTSAGPWPPNSIPGSLSPDELVVEVPPDHVLYPHPPNHVKNLGACWGTLHFSCRC